MERGWSAVRSAAGLRAWDAARRGAQGPIIMSPVVAFRADEHGALRGLLCVALDARSDGEAASTEDLAVLARLLLVAARAPRDVPRHTLLEVRQATDPTPILREVVVTARGNMCEIARVLQCDRKTAYSRIRAHGLEDLVKSARRERRGRR